MACAIVRPRILRYYGTTGATRFQSAKTDRSVVTQADVEIEREIRTCAAYLPFEDRLIRGRARAGAAGSMQEFHCIRVRASAPPAAHKPFWAVLSWTLNFRRRS